VWLKDGGNDVVVVKGDRKFEIIEDIGRGVNIVIYK